MSIQKVNKQDGSTALLAGSTLYAAAPVGTILPFGGNNIPSGWGLCDGSAVSRTTYAELFAVIGTAFGSGDGSTTFNLPDMRESVPKCAGLTGKTVGAHLDADGLAVGEFLDDRVQTHIHSLPYTAVAYAYNPGGGEGYGQSASYKFGATNNHDGRSGATTEVKSVGVNYIICMVQTALPADFLAKVDEAVEDVYGDIIPSDASASNQLVTESESLNAPITVLRASSSNPIDFNDLVPDDLTISSRKIFFVLVNDSSYVSNSPRNTRNMIVICYNTIGNTTRQNQIALSEDGTKQMWVRNCTGGTWAPWAEFVRSDDLNQYYHKCIYSRTNTSGSQLVKTLTAVDGKCYIIEGYQGDNYRRTRVYLFSGVIRTIDEITSSSSPFTLSSSDNVVTITFANWSYNQCRIYEESPANGASIG